MKVNGKTAVDGGPLLLGSDIDQRVKNHIRGRVARAGGTVDQLVDYRHCIVEDINIPDGGFGRVFKDGFRGFAEHTIPFLKRFIRQEVLFLLQGQRVSRDRKTIILDMHEAHLKSELHGRYDSSISSNLLEHSPNPIWLLLNFHFITKDSGFQFHAIPHGRYTYDRFREPTPFEHLIEDFERGTDAADVSHVEDYRQSAIEKDGWQKDFHERYPLSYPFIHFHVFDEHNTRELFAFMFEEVTNDVLRTDRFSDNVLIFRNRLSADFLGTYRELMAAYGPMMAERRFRTL